MKIIKRLVIGLAIVAVIVIGGVFLAINLIDPNDYKDKIQSVAMEQTGRALNIDGDIELSYFPWAGFALGKITMANADGFGEVPFAQIDSAQVKVKLLPLLKKSINVKTIELAGLNLDLQRAADGQTNWDDLLAETTASNTASTAEPASDSAGEKSANPTLSIGEVVISNANINWSDRQNNTDAKLSGFNLTSSAIDLTKPFTVTTDFSLNSDSIGVQADVDGTGNISLDLDNQQYRIKGLKLATAATGNAIPVQNFALSLNTDVVADLNAQTASLQSLLLTSMGVELTGDVEVTDLSGIPVINTDLKSNTFNPRELAAKLGVELPPTTDSEVLNTASLSVNLSGSAQAAKLGNLTIKLDDTTFNGSAELPDLTQALPPVKFEFIVDNMDLDRYLPVSDQTTGDSENTPVATTSEQDQGAQGGDTTIELPVAMMQKLDIDGVFKVGIFKVSNLTTADIEIPVLAKNGLIKLSDIKASLYDGGMNSNLSIDVNSAEPVYQFAFTVDGVQAEPLLQDLLQDSSPLSGQTILSADFGTRGNTINQLQSALNGKFNSDFTDGAINGINIGYQLRRTKAFFSNASEPVEQTAAKTDFSTMHLSGTISDGVVQSDDLDVRAPALRISGAGTVDLPQQLVDYTVKPKVVGTTEGQGGKDLEDLKGVAVNVPVRGTFDELSQDFTGTIIAAMRNDFTNQAKDRAKALAQKEKDRIKAEAKEKTDAVKREAEEKLQAEKARAKAKANEEIARQKERADQAADELKERAADKLKSLFK